MSEIIKKLLLVSGSAASRKALMSVTSAVCGLDTDACGTASEAGQLMEGGSYMAMLVNTPLNDSQGIDLSVYVCQKLHYPVMMITGSVTAERVGTDLRGRGIVVMARPVEKVSFTSALTCMVISAKIAADLRGINAGLENELRERRLVARAKAMLIKYMGMTEDQSHRFIEKQAMDLRLSKSDVARNILKTYYNK